MVDDDSFFIFHLRMNNEHFVRFGMKLSSRYSDFSFCLGKCEKLVHFRLDSFRFGEVYKKKFGKLFSLDYFEVNCGDVDFTAYKYNRIDQWLWSGDVRVESHSFFTSPIIISCCNLRFGNRHRQCHVFLFLILIRLLLQRFGRFALLTLSTQP